MSELNLLQQIAEAELVGRGGAAFPVAYKWRRMKEHQASKKYVVCNGSEGEPDVKKDWHILANFPEKVFQGMVLAMDFLETKEGFFNLNADYYQQLKDQLDPLFKKYLAEGYLINLYLEKPSYIGGETGALLNSIEGKKAQPRIKPPSPSIAGINSVPVLLQNVETFYDIALVAEGQYQQQRFVTINHSENEGVFALNRDLSVEEALKSTNNYPDQEFFVQVGGGASGVVLHQDQLAEAKLIGCASITIYPITKKPLEMLKLWADFFEEESCGKCTPCREGTWQIKRLIDESIIENKLDEYLWQKILIIANNMEKTSLCGLGQALIIPLKTYYQNIWLKQHHAQN
jgi:NADH:ubiquinone oxidoreductase subunit F (NADH-binding)